MRQDILLNAGFSPREIEVYFTLIKKGELTAGEVAKITGRIRPNTYDVLNSLISKGVVSYVVRNNKKYFHAADPQKIVDYLESRKDDLDDLKKEVVDSLSSFSPIQSRFNKPIIEIYEGKEGLKTILSMSVRESLRTKKEILGISVQQQKCRELAEHYHTRWYEHRKKYVIKSKYILSADEEEIPVGHTKFKRFPMEAKNPSEIFIFGDVTSQFFFVGGSFTAIVIKNKEVTDSYRDYFDFLWKTLDKNKR